jgi:hypothetical protein
MRIVHITAGAGGRICGSCLHDNALVRALRQRGRDAILLPAYVPTTTDEENVAERRVVMGGVNIWLQEFVPFFRHTPWFLDRLLDGRRLLTWLAGQTAQTKPEDLGTITVSALEGEGGHQRKEVEKLASLLRNDLQPDVVHLSNILLLGLARPIRAATGAAIVSSLSGEDIFIGQLPPAHRDRVLGLLRERAGDVGHRGRCQNALRAVVLTGRDESEICDLSERPPRRVGIDGDGPHAERLERGEYEQPNHAASEHVHRLGRPRHDRREGCPRRRLGLGQPLLPRRHRRNERANLALVLASPLLALV